MSLTHPPNETAPCTTGNLRLKAGNWWVNLAAVYRDAVISHPGKGGLTYDQNMAYAVLLDTPEEGVNVHLERPEKYNDPYGKGGPENSKNEVGDTFVSPRANGQGEQSSFGKTIKYSVLKKDPKTGKGVVKLMRTMASLDPEKKVVRLFRSWRAPIEGSPRGGVRYEGL